MKAKLKRKYNKKRTNETNVFKAWKIIIYALATNDL